MCIGADVIEALHILHMQDLEDVMYAHNHLHIRFTGTDDTGGILICSIHETSWEEEQPTV